MNQLLVEQFDGNADWNNTSSVHFEWSVLPASLVHRQFII